MNSSNNPKINNRNTLLRLILIGIGTMINLCAGLLSHHLQWPIYLDTLGTLLTTILGGIPSGIVTGIASSLVGKWVVNPVLPYYTGTHIAVALFTGWMVQKGFFKNLPRVLLTGLLLGIVSGVVSAPVVIAFGGITETSTDPTTLFLTKHGISFPMSVFLSNFATEPLDKIALCLVAFWIIKTLPWTWKKQIQDLGYLRQVT